MKVILKQDVAKIGKKYDLAEIPTGYAMNTLIPQGKVIPATPENKKAIEQIKNRMQSDVQSDIDTAQAVVDAYKTSPLSVSIDTNENGQLFQALTPEHIVAAAHETGVEIPVKMLAIPHTIKELGVHTVHLVAGKEEYPLSLEVVGK